MTTNPQWGTGVVGMNKKILLFKYETFAVHRPKCREIDDAPRKHER